MILKELNFAIAITFYTDNCIAVLNRDKLVEMPMIRPMGMCFMGDRTLVVAVRHGLEIFDRFADPNSDKYWYRQKLTKYMGHTDGHEIANVQGTPVLANTFFNCLSIPDPDKDFQPVYQPSFVKHFVAEDRIHLNGIAIEGDRLHYVSCFSDRYVEEKRGWRKNPNTGCVWDVMQEKPVIQNLTLPHSPRVIDGKLFVCDSGKGRVLVRDGDTLEVAIALKSFTRGLIAHDKYIIVGTSKYRESNHNKQLDRQALTVNKCGIHFLCRSTYKLLQSYYFEGKKDIFDLQIMPRNNYVVSVNSKAFKFLHLL